MTARGRTKAEIRDLVDPSTALDQACAWIFERWGHLHTTDVKVTLDWMRGAIAAEREAVLGAFAGRKLAGVALLVEHELDQEPDLTPWLSGFFVAPDYRGQGAGDMLLEAFDRRAIDLGYDRAHLYCEEGRLVSYYERHGWLPMKRIDVDGEPHRVMSKALLV